MSTERANQPPISCFTLVILSVAGLLLIFVFLTPNFVGRGPGKLNRIVNNLRQLDGAKQRWALEHNQTGAVVLTQKDLAPYLGHLRNSGNWVAPVAGESYRLRTLEEFPEAELTRKVESLAKGTVIRLGTNRVDIINPKQ